MLSVHDFLFLVSTIAAVLASVRLLNRLLASSYGSQGRRTKKRAPIAGTLFHQLLHFRRYHDYLTDLTRHNNTFRLLGLTHDEIFTADPANVEHILKTNFHNYGKGWLCMEITKELLGDGIFAVDGEKWHHQRKLASFEFSTKVLRDFSCNVFKGNAVKLAHIVSEAACSNKIIDLQDLFMKSTMDSIFNVAFGVDLNCLNGKNEEESKFAKAFDDSSMQVMWRLINPLWTIARFLNIGSEATFKRNIKVVDDFTYKLISTKMNVHSRQGNHYDGRQDILSRFLLQSKKDPENMNSKYLRDIILNFVVAGKDTTASTLSWFFYMLCKHPFVQKKIAFEVTQATRSSNCTEFGDFTAILTEEVINSMHYLHATLSETLRLYPAVASDSKVCFSDDELPDGFCIRKGDIVTYQPYPMGRMKFIWGEDAELFRPERWLDENGLFHPENPFKFPAFQAGPRTCLGKEFAYRQMKIFAAVLLRFFAFDLDDENKVVTYKTMLTLHIDQGLYLRVIPR